MIKFVKCYKTRTVAILKDETLVAKVSLDELKDLVNNFDVDVCHCIDLK